MIAVHAGAGIHLESKRSTHENVCKAACDAGLQALNDNLPAIDAVTRAIMAMEDDPSTNCGYGSNLCRDGTIECDASLMDGHRLLWSGVGAVPGIKNPIKISQLLLEEQTVENPYGLIPPNIIVGEAAKRWAESRGLITANLETEQTRSVYNKLRHKIDRDDISVPIKFRRLDTVGAVAVDKQGHVAAGVSSGGILFKVPGRVGQAATYGAGCWAQDSIGISTSGSGEYLIKTLFAKECASHLLLNPADDLVEQFTHLFSTKFTDSPFLKSVKTAKSAGLITVIHDAQRNTNELIWVHNTPTMCLAYGKVSDKSPRFIFSKYPGQLKSAPTIQSKII
ncbi:threonine aspartase 1 [Tetranychus urticae]|uniref:Uncharacterized protein n=1 Tax=Tetranychus urticae TaxID=32264 RepID=T1JVM7_TETUR|nr:threonine aspartase 1 [Tetranychus urticae]